MPLTLTLFPQWDFAHFDYAGRVTVGDIARCYDSLMSAPEALELRHALHDMRALNELSVFYDGMMQMARTVSVDTALRAKPLDIAIVSVQTDWLALLTDYCAEVSRSGIARCALFPEVPTALHWLGTDKTLGDMRLGDGRRITDPRPD